MTDLTDVDICNLAMGLLGATKITSLSPPVGGKAKDLVTIYPQRLKAELRKRRWRFALSTDELTADGSWASANPRAYRYILNNAVVRVTVAKGSDWVLRGNFIYTDCFESPLYAQVIRSDLDPALFDPLFVDVLAASIASFMAEDVTQSNTKKADAKQSYADAVKIAGAANAFELGPQEAPLGTWAQQLGG